MDIRRIIGNNVRDARERKGLTQRELGKLAGRHMVYISAIERGERNLTVQNLAVIATALNVPPHLLLIEDVFIVKRR